MKYDFHLTNTETGESAVYQEDYDWFFDETEPHHNVIYYWTEGNFSCDCNRLICLGLATLGDYIKCSEGRIRLDKITQRDNGQVVWSNTREK